MKMNYLIIVLVMMAAIFSGCHRRVVVVKRTPVHRLPPGQAKKLTGTQSARSYAPGHQKKKG